MDTQKQHRRPITDSIVFAMLSLAALGGHLLSPSFAEADIYRFVTVDGVETFTDAPLDKQAKVVIRDTVKKQSRSARKSSKPEKVHNISLEEVVEKTVRSATATPDIANSDTFEAKLPPVGGRITSGVGMRIDPIDGKLRHHNGIDIAIPEGTPINPVAPGVVIYSGLRSGYGYTLLVEHNNGMVTLYGHNSRLLVSAGQQVDRETVIALSGNTGRSTGPHLHFEAWQSGANVTSAFMPGSGTQISNRAVASHYNRSTFRKEILADGSILFTNTPPSIRR